MTLSLTHNFTLSHTIETHCILYITWTLYRILTSHTHIVMGHVICADKYRCFWAGEGATTTLHIPTTTKDKIIPITAGYLYPLPFNTHRAHMLSLSFSHLHTHFQKVRTFRVKKMVLYSLSHISRGAAIRERRGLLTALPFSSQYSLPGSIYLSFLHHPPAVSLALSPRP